MKNHFEEFLIILPREVFIQFVSLEDGEEEEEEELVELPGGLDQLEAIMEDYNAARDNSFKVFKDHGKSGKLMILILSIFIFSSQCVSLKYG